jgi:Holliday junction resolvase RusA-like endonuclease
MRREFFAPGIPKGQPRPRAFSRNGHARVFDPGTAEGWKSAVAVAAQDLRGAFTSARPLKVAIRFTFPRPKTHRRRDGSLRPGAPIFHSSKPDIDNAAKAVLDALTQIGVWADDCQVVNLFLSKRYADDGRPGAQVTIDTITIGGGE